MMRKRARSAGFTLIELLAVLGVMVLVSTIIFANNSRFGGSVILQNLAHEVALSIRQAQTYGVSVLQFKSKFASAYGIHFDTGNRTRYVIFADRGGGEKDKYDSGEAVSVTRLASGYQIQDLYVDDCGTATTDTLNITFHRPEPEAYINGSGGHGQLEQMACIKLVSPKRAVACIRVYATGQIEVSPCQ